MPFLSNPEAVKPILNHLLGVELSYYDAIILIQHITQRARLHEYRTEVNYEKIQGGFLSRTITKQKLNKNKVEQHVKNLNKSIKKLKSKQRKGKQNANRNS